MPTTILIVDDSRTMRSLLASMVQALGYRAITADSGAAALRALREESPSLVLLDVVLPDLTGFEVVAAIKRDPRFVPVILLTNQSDVESKRRGHAAGADELLPKTTSALELQIRIAAMLRIKSLTDALEEANKRLGELATTDALTGIANRRRFEEVFSLEFERAKRYRRPLALLALDIDHFKQVNDQHGHAVGDDVLRVVASTLDRSLRRTDLVGRMGGEEFAVVAPETATREGTALAERLRVMVGAATTDGGAGPLQCTVSIGVASWDGVTDVAPSELRERSDRALYAAKRDGRNRVVLDASADGAAAAAWRARIAP